MSEYLMSIGFIQSKCDPCLFILYKGKKSVFAGLFVDDMLVAASDKLLMAWISNELRTRWNTVFHTGDEFNYVGLHIVRDRQDRSLRIDMSGNIKKLVENFGADIPISKVPAIQTILVQSGDPLDTAGKTEYMSLVMSILYPARMCHMAVLFPTTILATRMQTPTTDDLAHAKRIIGYLKTQVNGGFTIRGTPESKLKVYVDASHSIHPDGKGHGCMIMCIGNSPVAWRAYKLPHVTLSSTESEISAVSESTTYVYWGGDLFVELRHDAVAPHDVLQDNDSAVTIMEEGGSFKRTKHMLTRLAFIREQVAAGLIRFVPCRTNVHCGDLLTKVHPASRINELLRLLSWDCPT
jgi:hypothetical protein